MSRRGPRWFPRRYANSQSDPRPFPRMSLFPATLEELCVHWRRHHPEDAHLTDAELEKLFANLQRGRDA